MFETSPKILFKPCESILPKPLLYFCLHILSLSTSLHFFSPSFSILPYVPPLFPSTPFPFLPSLPPLLLSAMQMCFLWFCHQRLISTLLGVLFIPPAERGGKNERERERNEEWWEWETDRLRQKTESGKDECGEIEGLMEKQGRTERGR